MGALVRLGHVLFRTRNAIFPIMLLAVFAAWPARPLGQGHDAWWVGLGLLVLAAGQGLRVATIGLDYIRRGGKNGRIYADRLVTGGLFACCRNPMYTGNVLMIVGFFLICANPTGWLIGSAIGWFVYRAIIASEEAFLAETFAAEYDTYCQQVPRWLPAFRPMRDALRSYTFDWPSVVIREYGTLFTTLLITLALLAWKAYLAHRLSHDWVVLLAVAVLAAVAYGWARYLKKSRRLRPLERIS